MPFVHHAVARAFAALVLLAAPAGAQQVAVGTGPPATPAAYAAPFGNSVGFFDAVGQTFVAPSASVALLDGVQLWLRNTPLGGPGVDLRLVDYRLWVAPFDPVSRRVAGAPVFVSAPRAGTASTAATPTAFATGGIALAPGQLYLAFLAPDDPPSGAPALLTPLVGQVLGFADDPYAGGQAYTLRYLGAPTNPNAGPLALAWTAATPGADLAFQLTFSAVPEPATVGFVGVGAALVGAWARRRRGARP